MPYLEPSHETLASSDGAEECLLALRMQTNKCRQYACITIYYPTLYATSGLVLSSSDISVTRKAKMS